MKAQNSKALVIVEGGIASGATQRDENRIEILDFDNLQDGVTANEARPYFDGLSRRAKNVIRRDRPELYAVLNCKEVAQK